MMGHPSESLGVARRANAVPLLDKGWSRAEVSEALYLDDDTVRAWLKRSRDTIADNFRIVSHQDFRVLGRGGYSWSPPVFHGRGG